MNSNHVNYVASEGKFNIWERQDISWQLLSDSNEMPLEFDTKELAKEQQSFYTDKVTLVRPAPTKIHPTDYLNLSDSKIEEFLVRNSITEPVVRKVFSEILAASTPIEQSRIWVAALEGDPRYYLVKYRYYENTNKIVRSIYFSESYYSQLVELILYGLKT